MAKSSRRAFKSIEHKGLTFLNKGAENYLSARILYMNNQLYDAGVLSHEALEKVMKALLYLNNTPQNLDREHDLLVLKGYLETELGLDLSDQIGALGYYQDCYNYRYPDNVPPSSFSTGTVWFHHLDAYFMFYHDLCINSLTKEEDKRRNGIYENCLPYFENGRSALIENLTHSNSVVTKQSIDDTRQWWKNNGYLTFDNRGIMKLPSGGTHVDKSKASL